MVDFLERLKKGGSRLFGAAEKMGGTMRVRDWFWLGVVVGLVRAALEWRAGNDLTGGFAAVLPWPAWYLLGHGLVGGVVAYAIADLIATVLPRRRSG